MGAKRNNRLLKLHADVIRRHLHSLNHPLFHSKPCPSHNELIAAAAEVFGLADHLKPSRRKNLAILAQMVDASEPMKKRIVTLAKKGKLRVSQKREHGKKCRAFVATDDFLSSYEWRKLRYQALQKYGAKCGLCGNGRHTGRTLNVDHIKPRKLFPELALDIDNLQVLCADCNHGKGNWDQTDWRQPEVLH